MSFHTPVLLEETLEALNLKPGITVVDVTLGGGGHAGEIVRRISPAGHLIGLDQDPEAIQESTSHLQAVAHTRQLKLDITHARFDQLQQHLTALQVTAVDAVLADLGVSSHQLDTQERGFSFHQPAPLDMRMDHTQGQTAEQLIQHSSESDLARILRDYGEESLSLPIARAMKQAQELGKLTTTQELADIVASISRRRYKTPSRVHPATRTFQALRIAVNQELDTLEQFLPQALHVLKPGGRLAVITFHSLEDRIVKHFFQLESKGCICPPELPVCRCGHKPRLKSIFKKPITPSVTETTRNPRARSAKLRVVERI